MRVLKVVAEGLTTSFRYPHFMQEVHPTYEMPPPATIYGHICSALGEWVDARGLRFAYRFTFDGQVDDLEHVIVLGASTGKLPNTGHAKVLEGRVSPFRRALLFHPQLTLYLNRPEWEAAFRSPRYAVALGRSQDLFTYRDVTVVDLDVAQEGYFEHTLLPYDMALQAQRGYAVLMPRYLDYSHGRTPAFARYVILHDRVDTRDTEFRRYSDRQVGRYLVDPTSPSVKGVHLALPFHAFIGDNPDDAAFRLA